MASYYFLFLILFYYSLNVIVFASLGDNHYLYRACLNHCKQMNCSTSLGLRDFQDKQTFFEYIFQWSCQDECSYECMWKTVNDMEKNDQDIEQFHGNNVLQYKMIEKNLCTLSRTKKNGLFPFHFCIT
ncbi:unnamed protein product [Rotaria sp. Silwood2]|nr:unnamed protein product [Rotaria sp. Silwood2]